jgi:hypothetical protein
MSSHHEFDGTAPQKLSHNRLPLALSNGLAESRLLVRKSRGTFPQNEFQIDTAKRRVGQIEAMIADLNRVANLLDDEIRAEQSRTGIQDPDHFAYPTYAKATIARRDNLKRSIDVLKDMLNGVVHPPG